MTKIDLNVKPLSVNAVRRGRRFKTPAYTKYEKQCLMMLPKLDIERPDKIGVQFNIRFSSKRADLDNVTKPLLDILVKKYGRDDSRIYRIVLEKEVVKKGKEGVGIEFYEVIV